MTDAASIGIAKSAAELRPSPYRLALLQLRDGAAADDVVQEALLAAIEGSADFDGCASVRTWVFAILRHKVLDALRARARQKPPPAKSCADDEFDTSAFDAMFNEAGCWAEPKVAWADPYAAAERQAFFKVLEACLGRLPPRTSRAFLMRE